jgi:hypothetical protein
MLTICDQNTELRKNSVYICTINCAFEKSRLLHHDGKISPPW